ncbi:MAG: long-chain acyl-CoA synthetase [Myxococcota bacterium]|jgi:long-chain acyl-CoA synthetase
MVENAAEKTLSAVLAETTARVPDATALLSDERCLTWAELSDEAGRLAALFLQIGIGAGDVIGFAIDKKPEVVVGFLAAARIGAVMAPINFKLHPDRIIDQFRTSNITAILTQVSRRKMMDALAAVLPAPARRIYVGTPGPEGTSRYADHAGLEPIGEQPGITPDTPCYYNYTSGTTGRPKGAVTTHRHILVNAVSTIEGLGFTEDDIFLGMFSVFAHPHELFHRSIVVGGGFAILDSISPRRIAESVARFKVTWMMAVPSFYEMMLDYAAPRNGVAANTTGKHDLSSLRILESGGAYVGAETMNRMEALFGATFLPVWGCTEATGVGIANGPGPWRKPGATGRAVPGYEIRAVDDDGNDVPFGSVGEMLLRGPALASGYVNQPEETAAAFVDGWYHTSDLIILDEEGFVQFSGRRSEMLKIGGIRVYPLEIETAVKSHPDVRDVVVVRAEERLRGEIARAVVQAEPGSALSVRDVQAWCRTLLAGYKVPRIVEFWQEIPKLPNGKIDKRAVVAITPDASRDER